MDRQGQQEGPGQGIGVRGGLLGALSSRPPWSPSVECHAQRGGRTHHPASWGHWGWEWRERTEVTDGPGCCQRAVPGAGAGFPHGPPGRREGGERWGRTCPGSPPGAPGQLEFPRSINSVRAKGTTLTTEAIEIALLTQSPSEFRGKAAGGRRADPRAPCPPGSLAAHGGGKGSPGVGSCSWRWPGVGSRTGLGDREEPLCKGAGQPGARVWPSFSGPSFVTASPETAFFLPKEQSFDLLLLLRGIF